MLCVAAGTLFFAAIMAGVDYRRNLEAAKEFGLPTELPDASVDSEFRKDAAIIREYSFISNANPSLLQAYKWYSNDRQAPHAALHRITEGKPQNPDTVDADAILKATRWCRGDALLAILEQDPVALNRELTALKGIVDIVPEDWAGFRSRIMGEICALAAVAAEHATNTALIDAIEPLFANWEEPSYLQAARHLAANALEDDIANTRHYRDEARAIDDLEFEATPPRAQRRRANGLRNAIQVVQRWDDHREILRESDTYDIVLPNAAEIKMLELESALALRAARVTLAAHRFRLETGRLPTIVELQAQGLPVEHPLNRARFTWMSVDGTLRLASLAYCRESMPHKEIFEYRRLGLDHEWAKPMLAKPIRATTTP